MVARGMDSNASLTPALARRGAAQRVHYAIFTPEPNGNTEVVKEAGHGRDCRREHRLVVQHGYREKLGVINRIGPAQFIQAIPARVGRALPD